MTETLEKAFGEYNRALLEGHEQEVQRLREVVAAQRRLLIQWTEAYQELFEQTKFLNA